MTIISSNLQAIQLKIAQAAHAAGRKNTAIKLLAVSKMQDAHAIRAAYAAGQRLFGENYVQEALSKQAQLQDLAIEWHFIGPIQSNKTSQIAQHFAWVHGVDRLKIAQRLNAARSANLAPLKICLQVNNDAEPSKSGVIGMAALLDLAQEIRLLPRLQLCGLMAIPAPSETLSVQQRAFAEVRCQLEALNQAGYRLETLSMGMSEDYAAAILEGATIIRIGTALFGARSATSVKTSI